MNISWLVWFEENPSATPTTTLENAARRYTKKFGAASNRARVPWDWPESTPASGLFIERCRHIMSRLVHLALDSSLRREV